MFTDRSEGDINITPERARWQSAAIDSASRTLLDRDDRAFVRQALSTPCLAPLTRASGSHIEDSTGRRYLDFHGNSVHHIGHGHPRVIRAIRDQLDALPFCPRRFTCEPAIHLAERLGSLSPGGALTKVLFAPGGAEAMSMAVKLARAATGRYKTIAFHGSFHGATLDMIAIGDEPIFRHRAGPLMPGCLHVHPPAPSRCDHGCAGSCTTRCAETIESLLAREPDVAAVIAEPIRCTTVDLPPANYWARVRAACDRAGALLIFDEIPIWAGRTGRMFSSQHEGVVPDMAVIGKSLGGGVFPLAAMLARRELDCIPEGALGHFTHEKSPVGAAAALAFLDVIESEHLCERSAIEGERFVSGLRTLAARHPVIREVRGRGMLIGIELATSADQPAASVVAERVLYGCLARGLSFKVSGGTVLTLTPPLNIDRGLLDRAVEILDEALADALVRGEAE